MGHKYFRGGRTIRSLLVLPRTNIPSSRKVESYMDTNVTGWSVVKNILESLQEHLERSSRNIKRPLPQYMTTVAPLVTPLQ